MDSHFAICNEVCRIIFTQDHIDLRNMAGKNLPALSQSKYKLGGKEKKNRVILELTVLKQSY